MTIWTRIGTEVKSVRAALTTHVANVANPHAVTKAQVGLSNVPNVAPGYGITAGAVALTTVAATLGSDVAVPATTVTTLLSITLPAAGTYHVIGGTTVTGTTAANVDGTVALGTATGTFAGVTSGSSRLAANVYAQVIASTTFTCTAPGTLLLRAYTTVATTARATSANGYAGATGLVAKRIA